jgi:hypothetical protein
LIFISVLRLCLKLLEPARKYNGPSPLVTFGWVAEYRFV